MQKKLKVIDLFAGVGGLSYGFAHDPNFEIVAANEILPNMATAYQLNHPNVKMYCKDIKKLSFTEIKNDLKIKDNAIDIIVGGPPCQAYSTVGKRLIDDPRGQLFQEYLRILKEINPKVFIFENVKGLLSMQKGELINEIIALFKSQNYRVEYKVLNTADFGTPQIRERVIIVGTKLKNKYNFPKETHYNPEFGANSALNKLPYLTLGEAISDLPFIKSNESADYYSSEPQNIFQKVMRANAPTKLQDHSSAKNNPNLVKLMENLPDGGTPLDIPEELRPSSGFANTYSKLWWNKPSTTITRNLGTPSSSRCIHPKTPRALTTREGARIQCFPDNYKFFGSRSDKNLQIGNAVPTFLSIALKNSLLEHFASNDLNREQRTIYTKQETNLKLLQNI